MQNVAAPPRAPIGGLCLPLNSRNQRRAAGGRPAEFEAEDVDGPESSNLPLNWLPQQHPQADVTEEEPDEVLGGPEVEPAGESSPRLERETDLSSGGDGNASPVAQGWGQATGWVASGKQASGDKLPEHSEVNPTVDLSSVRSWSSGTVSLDHPSDSLDSTWDGDTSVPQPTALAETLSQSPSHHRLDSDDRTGGSVAVATPLEFQDSSASPAHSLRCPAGAWRREATSLSCPQPGDGAWKRTRPSPKPLPSRFTGTISPLNSPPRPTRQDRPPPRQGATLAGQSSSDTPKYGRGRLNYPLPDFSKVGPRVRFPKDESYRPPKARSHSREPQGHARPLIFKSPAEIVQEVLLSSGEACLGKDPPPAHPITRVPQEFQTPEQATKLVHQLQEDYHKLLTKYAEAENTIDQLRLGAKVNLYSDPPQPSHSMHMGTMPQGTKVLAFTIPQPHSVERRLGPTEALPAAEASEWPSAQGDLSRPSATSSSTPGCLLENLGIAQDQPSAEPTEALASQARWFLAKVESFMALMQTGRLTPRDQLKGFQRLKAAHAALEEEYLRACRGQPLAQQPTGSEGTPGKFDPGRELEAEIFQLGIRLEELKDHVEQNQQEPEQTGSDSALDSPPATPSPHQPTGLPSPSGQAPELATQILCPEPDAPSVGPCPLHVNVELSAASSEVGDTPLGLPAPLRPTELLMEQDFHRLLERYLSVKSLPEALRTEEEEEEVEAEGQGHTQEVDGLAPPPGKAEATRLPTRPLPAQAERSHGAPLEETLEQMVPGKPAGSLTSMARDGHPQGLGKAEAASPGPRRPPPTRDTKSAASHQSSLTSLEGSGISERLPQKSRHQAGRPHVEEPWMASPETDSGFVGSETSRVSPLAQTPEHRLSHISAPGPLTQPFTASAPRNAASHPQTRGPPVPRRVSEPSTPRSRAQRRPSGRDSPRRQRAPSFRLERALAAEMALPGSELEGRKRVSEQRPRSTTVSPPSTPAPAPAVLPCGLTETTSTLLLTRTGRDQAIRELQEEVARLRLRLEDSLHPPAPGSPTRPASAFNRPARARARPAEASAPWGPHCGSKSTERLSGEPGGAEPAVPAGRRRARSSSVPREVPRLSLSSESEPASLRLFSEKSRTTTDSPPTAGDGMRGVGSARRPDRVTFRGQYTGQEYQVLTPKTVPRGSGTASCPHCQPVRTQDAGGAAPRDPPGPSPTDVLRCPLCGGAGSRPEGDASDPPTSGAEKASTRGCAPATSSPKQRSQRVGSPSRPPPGLWYLAAAPSAPPTPALAYVSPVPVLPYPSATVSPDPDVVPALQASWGGSLGKPAPSTARGHGACAGLRGAGGDAPCDPLIWQDSLPRIWEPGCSSERPWEPGVSPLPRPFVPCPSRLRFFASPGPTSARPASEWHSSSSARPARGPRHSVQLDLEDLEALHQALSRAVGAAERVRSRSRQLSRALEAELRQAPSLRGSCPL
ncbi:microtubule organization protein AKNA isoform X3 [Equus asinus]|uniref:microtubule organization protein AKNA isoform X3 n=1 Tax=Equus asinus TaxID=9793 RepID=UPI0038F7F2B7